MNVPLCLVTIFLKTLLTNFDETLRILSKLPKIATENKKISLNKHFPILEMGREAAFLVI